MALNKRSYAILQTLIQNEHYVSIHELMKKFNVSRRTIYYEIDRINYWLEKQRIKPIKHERFCGFYLEELPGNFHLIKTLPYEYSIEERIAWIALHLLMNEDRLLIKTFEQWLDVSRNTVISDINKLRKSFKSYHLSLIFNREQGYVLEGEEYDKRRARVSYLSFLLTIQRDKKAILQKLAKILGVASIDLSPIYKVLNLCEESLQVHYADEDLFFMALQIYLNIHRMRRQHYIEMNEVEKEVIQNTLEYKIIVKVVESLEKDFDVIFSVDESHYLTTYLLSAKLQHQPNQTVTGAVQSSLKMVVSKMVDDFELYAGVVFQDRKKIETNLFIHLQPAFYRSIYGLHIQNPLTKVIKEKYYEIYSITERVIHHFEKLTGQPLTENEIAFIAIHFGGWFRPEKLTFHRKKALIICNYGIGTSEILRKQLQKLFPMVDFHRTLSVREYEQEEDWPNVSFSVSTVQVKKKNHPLFVVSPILTENEKIRLSQRIYSIIGMDSYIAHGYCIDSILQIIKKHALVNNEKRLERELEHYFFKKHSTHSINRPSLLELLNGNIQIIERIKDWKEAIRRASEPLLQKGKINESYVDSMIKIIQEKGPYMIAAPGIALPHATPKDGVFDVGMSLLIIKEPVYLLEEKDQKVNILIVLAPKNQESHLRAMSELNSLLSCQEKIKDLKECTSREQVLYYLKTNEEKGERI